jgi:hypothetical protein
VATKSQVLAAARRKWGKSAGLMTRLRALPKARRLQVLDEMREMRALLKSSADRPDGEAWQALREAARFVVDVGGDAPSIPQLAAALRDVDGVTEHNEERAATRAEIKRLEMLGAYHPKFAIFSDHRTPGGTGFRRILVEADTLAELLEAITRKEATC